MDPPQPDQTLTWAVAFALTVLVELPVMTLGTRDLGLPLPRRLAVALLAQVLTHPLVWFAFPPLFRASPELGLWLSELFAFAAEALLYALTLRNIGWTRAVALSGLANGLSLGLGTALEALSA